MSESPQFSELVRIKQDYVDKGLGWYKDNSTLPRIVFRITGTLTIILSLGIPFLAAAGGKLQSYGVSLAALTIAVVTALNAFFGWQKTWEKRRTAQLSMEGLIAAWEIEMDAAKRIQDSEKSYITAKQATEDLVEATRSLTIAETGSWFSMIKFPTVPTKPSRASEGGMTTQ